MLRYLKSFVSRIMLQNDNILMPPSAVRGMTILDRNAFAKKINFPALVIPVSAIKECKKVLRSKLPDLHLKAVQDYPETNSKDKLILLDPQAKLEDEEKQALNKLGIKTDFKFKKIEIGYEHFKARDILRAIVPVKNEDSKDELSISPRRFIQIGHILQLNLRAHQLPYRQIIGEVLVDKVPTAKTVVNKVENVSNEYRSLDMEILAGEKNFVARVVEHYRVFEFDFSKVFWNSRLSSEHHRMSNLIPSSDVVFDVCSGVGPFSIPLAKKGCRVYANDINPHCHHWMMHNIKLNKVNTMECFAMDGREFIKNNLKDYLLENSSDSPTVHVIMNLPGNAVEFLDAFPGLLPQPANIPEVKVYFYIFAGAEYKDEITARAAEYFPVPLPSDVDIRLVRNVSPSRNQFCVSFTLPKHLLFRSRNAQLEEDNEPELKRLRT